MTYINYSTWLPFLFLIGRKSGYFPYSIHFIAETQNRNNEGHDLLEISLLKQTGSHTHVDFKSHFSFIYRLSSKSNFTLWYQSGIEPENSRQYFKNGRKPWTYFHHVETRCSPKGTCWWNHQAFRTKRIQAGGHENDACKFNKIVIILGKGVLTCSWHMKSKLWILFCNVFLGGRNHDCNQKNAVALLYFKSVKTGSSNQQYIWQKIVHRITSSVHENCKLTVQNMLCT